MTVSFFVPGLPIAQERARSGHGHWYDPVKSKAWKDVISWHAQRHRLAKAGKAPISVNLVFVFPLSKSSIML